VIFRWFTRPEDSETSAAREPVCGIEGSNCQKEAPVTEGLLGEILPVLIQFANYSGYPAKSVSCASLLLGVGAE
jgi:hypothetical protein